MEFHTLNEAIFGSLFHLKVATLEFVIERLFSNDIPFNSSTLTVRNDISLCGIYFFKSVGLVTGDKHILKGCYTVFIGNGIFINGKTAERSAVKVELNTLNQVIFRSLNYFQVATLKNVVEGNGRYLITNNDNTSGFLRLILIKYGFRNRVSARFQIINLNLAVCIGSNSLINAVAFQSKGNALDNAIFGSLYDFSRAIVYFIDCIDSNKTVIVCIDSNRPFGFAVCVIVCWEYGFLYGISAVRYGIFSLGIAATVCRADLIRFARLGVGCHKDCTGKVLAVCVLLIHFDFAIGLKDFLRQVIICVRIRGLVASLSHPIDTGDFGTSIITNVDDEVNTVISA